MVARCEKRNGMRRFDGGIVCVHKRRGGACADDGAADAGLRHETHLQDLREGERDEFETSLWQASGVDALVAGIKVLLMLLMLLSCVCLSVSVFVSLS